MSIGAHLAFGFFFLVIFCSFRAVLWIPDGRNIENDCFDLVDKSLKVEMVDGAAEIHYKAKRPTYYTNVC